MYVHTRTASSTVTVVKTAWHVDVTHPRIRFVNLVSVSLSFFFFLFFLVRLVELSLMRPAGRRDKVLLDLT